MEIKFRGKSFNGNWVYGFYQEVEAEGNVYSYIFWQGNATPVKKETVGRVVKYDNKEYKEFDYNKDGEMLIFCNNCMGWHFSQIDISTKDVCVDCHNCEGNFMFHDAIHNFEPIGNFHD